MRRFVIIGQRASASPDFSLVDIPGTSGRLDILLRCLRSALLISHGLRQDTIAYLVLLGGPSAPRTLRFDGASARFLRPDERSLAVLVQKALAAPHEGRSFVEVRPGVAVAKDGLDAVLDECGSGRCFVLDERGQDLRSMPTLAGDAVYFVGDHRGFDEATRARIQVHGAVPVSVGPISIHADDAVTVVVNELDRRAFAASDP